MTTNVGLSDRQAIQHLLQFWMAYTPNIRRQVEMSHNLSTLVDGKIVFVCRQPEMTVTRIGCEYDVRGERNRGYTVFSIDTEGTILNPTSQQLHSFMVKSLNWGTIDKHVFRPLMQYRDRFDLAVQEVDDIRHE